MNRKLITAITGASALALFLATGAASCDSGPAGNAQENHQQQQDTSSLENNQPLPHFNYSQERQSLIAAETAAANGTQTTSFFFTANGTQPIFQCQSIGMGVPDSASLSNPDQVVNDPYSGSGGDGAVISQQDPDGIYVPASSTGTYVNCLNSKGQETLVRWEGDVMTLTAPATWNGASGLKLVGAPTVKITTQKPGK